MKVSFVKNQLPAAGTVVVIVAPDGGMSDAAREVNDKSGGLLTRAQQVGGKKPKAGTFVDLLAPANLDYSRVVVMVVDTEEKGTSLSFEELGGQLTSKLKSLKVKEATVGSIAGLPIDQSPEFVAAKLATGALLRAYDFEKYRSKSEDDEKAEAPALSFVVDDPQSPEFERVKTQTDAVFQARNLVSEPANVLYPESFADACEELTRFGLEVEIFDRAKLEELGMRALLGVNQGSIREPRVAVIRWNGGGEAKPVALVGKGVCFDSGGLSIKPASGMEDMKWDMGGAGAVFGAMQAVATRKAKANVVGLLGLVENMPSGSAQRPGDVVKAMSGKTIEVINTDAEGRLVLADVLWYAQDRFKPQIMINLATLTGAVITALGSEHAGLFSNNDTLADRLLETGGIVGDRLWRLPLGKDYDKHIKSDIADIKNVGRGRSAGSIAAAVFLQQFVNNVPWA
ncbi:MAG: leucyl aminopeptidase, partial [Pseudomonadota bacterium]